MSFIKKNLNLLANGAAALFSLLALICMAGAGLASKSGSYKTTISVFGVMSHNGGDGCEFGLVLALIFVIMLILAAAALIVLPMALKKDLSWLKWVALACAGIAFITFILFLCTKSMYIGTIARELGVKRSDLKGYANVHLGGGAVFAGIFSFLAAGCFALPTVLGKILK